MPGDKRERRSHFRGKPRPGRRVEVTVRVGERPPVKAFTRDIGIGGAFVVTQTPESPGTALTLLIHVPKETRPIEVRAEVRWISKETPTFPAGMGLKFHQLDVEELIQLNEYFASLVGTDDVPA